MKSEAHSRGRVSATFTTHPADGTDLGPDLGPDFCFLTKVLDQWKTASSLSLSSHDKPLS